MKNLIDKLLRKRTHYQIKSLIIHKFTLFISSLFNLFVCFTVIVNNCTCDLVLMFQYNRHVWENEI